MRILPTCIDGVKLLEPERHTDARGHFARTFCERELRDAGIGFAVRQCGVSFNPLKATLRGLHIQLPPMPEAKIVRCTRGALFDVAVDLRPDSPTRCHWFGQELTPDNGLGIYIPAGFAHGFITLEPETEVLYMMDQFHAPDCAAGVRWNDPAFGITWPLVPETMSENDTCWPDYE